MTRIFASGVYGSDYDLWGAWCFTDAGTRNKLAREIGPNDYCLAIGMMNPDTPKHERGRLISLIRIGSELIDTPQLVHPDKWGQSLRDYGERWMFGFPIRSVERFDNPPLRSDILPRIAAENLYRVVGRHYVELTPAEVKRVLSFPRTPDTNIYSTPVSAFASRLLSSRRGPRPTLGTRTLTAKSGPAATYRLQLAGDALPHILKLLQLRKGTSVWKIGFSIDPERRLRQINTYMPCEEGLCWKLIEKQWHEDEVNAWAMEQRIFDLLESQDTKPLKGEIICATAHQLETAWDVARRTAKRPTGPIKVDVSA